MLNTPPSAGRCAAKGFAMIVHEIKLSLIEVSELNVRKNLADGEDDSSISDLAKSINKQGLLNPITVYQKPDGRYVLIAGQRRLLACKQLGWMAIHAIVRDTVTDA